MRKTSKRRNVETSKRYARSLTVAVLMVFSGCEGDVKKSPDKASVSKTVQSDAVTLTVTATPDEVEVSQPLRLEVEIVAKPGFAVSIENYGHKLTESDRTFQYRVIRSEERPDQPTQEGKRRWLYAYELEFFLADRYELPAAKLTYAESRGGAAPQTEPESHVLETEPLAIVVRESATAKISPEELRRITVLDPVDLPRLWQRWGWVALPVLVLAVVLAVYLLRRRRRSLAEVVIPVPAHEWAYAEIARLIADELVVHNLMQEYFYRLSGIVRGYIERRFAVSAPEMTTEEFLAAAAQDIRFDPVHTDELIRFLNECDLVKYARHEPTSVECDGVLKAARRFIERTRERLFAAGGESKGNGTAGDDVVSGGTVSPQRGRGFRNDTACPAAAGQTVPPELESTERTS